MSIPEGASQTRQGIVADGAGSSAYWLGVFRDAYRTKTGLAIFPGTLNLHLDKELSLRSPEFASQLIRMNREEYQGGRDILMLPCVLENLGGLNAFIWRTTLAEQDSNGRHTLELLAEVNLRQSFGLKNGDVVKVGIPVLHQTEVVPTVVPDDLTSLVRPFPDSSNWITTLRQRLRVPKHRKFIAKTASRLRGRARRTTS